MTEPAAIVIEPRAEHRHSVIWLHGLGADGNDFVPLVGELDLPDTLGIRWVFPNAPEIPVTVNGGYVMPAWYDIAAADLTAEPDLVGMRQSRERLLALLQAEQGRGIPAERILLAGFSQGGVIALAAALAAAEKPAGVMALSTYLPLRDPAPMGSMAVFIGHGEFDDIVPLAAAADARDYLMTQGLTPEWHTYPMAHSLCAKEVDDIRRWLLACLKG